MPLAPHLAASFVVGAFSLLLYLTTWRLPYPDSHLPPATTTIQVGDGVLCLLYDRLCSLSPGAII